MQERFYCILCTCAIRAFPFLKTQVAAITRRTAKCNRYDMIQLVALHRHSVRIVPSLAYQLALDRVGK